MKTCQQKEKQRWNPGKTHIVKGESGLGFGPVCCCLSLGLSAVGDWAMLFTDKVAMLDPASTLDVGRSDTVGALGDGDVGGLKSSYLKTKCANIVWESFKKKKIVRKNKH